MSKSIVRRENHVDKKTHDRAAINILFHKNAFSLRKPEISICREE